MIETYTSYAEQFGSNEAVKNWVKTTLRNYLELPKNKATQEDVEHIIDYLNSEIKDISGMSYENASKNAVKWVAELNKLGEGIQESKDDTVVALDFKDGFKIVQLVGENAYKREGSLMGHCVAGYYGREVKVYSLRDKNNIPHCTMEHDQQIKGRGNKDVSTKYVDYIVKFLEHTGMKVRDSEMEHLGYEVVKFGKYTTTKCYKDRYLPKGSMVSYKSGYIILKSKKELESYTGNELVLFDGDLTVN